MFRTVPLSIIRSFSLYTQQWYMSYRFADSLLDRPCIVINSYNKPTGCTNFSNLFLEWNPTCFGQFLCPSLGIFHCTHSNGMCHTGLLTACSQAVTYTIADDGQTNCPKHIECHSKKNGEISACSWFIIRRKGHRRH